MKITLKFLGMDSWDRPVYEDETGTLWKDVSIRAGSMHRNCVRQTETIFDGEPDVPMSAMKKYANAEIQFIPERILWN